MFVGYPIILFFVFIDNMVLKLYASQRHIKKKKDCLRIVLMPQIMPLHIIIQQMFMQSDTVVILKQSDGILF